MEGERVGVMEVRFREFGGADNELRGSPFAKSTMPAKRYRILRAARLRPFGPITQAAGFVYNQITIILVKS